MSIPAYPIQWPFGWKRTAPQDRTAARFRKAGKQSGDGRWQPQRDVTIGEATERVRGELKRMGIHDDDLVITSNLELRLDGFPRSNQREPADPGVAVYWVDHATAGSPQRCMAIDRYDRVADNLAAVAATLDAMRAIERHGGAAILSRAFEGFAALPSPAAPNWREVLDPADPEGSYRRERARLHPDREGGSTEAFQRLQAAWAEYQKERGHG